MVKFESNIDGFVSEGKNHYLIGIDVGTTNIKGSLYSSAGDFMERCSISYDSITPKENWHEQNPNDWISNIIEVISRLFKNITAEDSVAVSFSTQGGTVVPVDRYFEPLTNAISWLDKRGLECFENNSDLNKLNDLFYKKTGWRMDSCMSFLPVYWLRENRENIFKKIYKILFVNDYILFKLTGNNCQDPSNASITLFFNVVEKKWDQYLLNLTGLTRENFSDVKESGDFVGYLDSGISKKIGIKNKVPIFNGGHDQYCAGIGAGIFDEKDILLSTGTAWVAFKLLYEPVFDSRRYFAIGRNIIKDKYGMIYSIPAAGASLKWFAREIMNKENENELFEIIKRNKKIFKERRNNIIFYPYLTGEHGPKFNIKRKAEFINLELGHNYLDLIKSIMEGVGFQFRKILDVFKERNIEYKDIKMVGGGSKSEVWPYIVANITGSDVYIPKKHDEDYATKGAAIIAGYGNGTFNTLKEGYDVLGSDFEVIKHDKEEKKYYEDKAKKYRL